MDVGTGTGRLGRCLSQFRRRFPLVMALPIEPMVAIGFLAWRRLAGETPRSSQGAQHSLERERTRWMRLRMLIGITGVLLGIVASTAGVTAAAAAASSP